MEYQEIEVNGDILMFPMDMSDSDIKIAIDQYIRSQSADKPAELPQGPQPTQGDALFDSLYQLSLIHISEPTRPY